MRSRNVFLMIATAIVAGLMAADVMAQPGGGGRGGRGGPGFGGIGGGGVTSALLNVDAVREEIEMTDEQWADAKKVIEDSRPERGERPNFRDMSEEERNEYMAKRRKEAEEREQKLRKDLGDVVLDHQFERLDEIAIQVQGIAALQMASVRKELKITKEQEKEVADKTREQMEGMREKMREIFQGDRENFDRDAMREKMTEIRKDMEKEILGVLSSDQKKTFEKMKGEPFKMPENALRGRRGGRGGGNRGGRGDGGGGGGRPERPE